MKERHTSIMRTSFLLLLTYVLLCGVAKAQTDKMTFDGNVGIATGDDSLNYKLQVGNSTDDSVNVIRIMTSGESNNAIPAISLGRNLHNECVLAQVPVGFVYCLSPHGLSYDQITSYTKLVISNAGNVGIGIQANFPRARLDVDGIIEMRGQDDYTTHTMPSIIPSDAGIIFASKNNLASSHTLWGSGANAGIFVKYGTTTSRLTSHADPRDLDPSAVTSFSDRSVEMPFSFYHMDNLVGKEQVVDMAKALAWVEKKMQSEMGNKAGRVFYSHDLPADRCLTLDQYNKEQSDNQVSLVLEKLDNLPWIKVRLEGDGNIPVEAFEEVPIVQTVMQKVVKKVKTVDSDAMRVVTMDRIETVPVVVPTGKTKRQLRPNWKLTEEGDLLRKPTASDVNLDTLIKDAPQLPQWVKDRIKSGRAASLDIKTLSEQIRQILAARDNTGTTKQEALATK